MGENVLVLNWLFHNKWVFNYFWEIYIYVYLNSQYIYPIYGKI